MTQFVLVTDWHFTQPLDRVWALIEDTERWPDWWPAVKKVETIRQGDETGLGAVRRITWGTALPYTLTFDVEVTKIEKHDCIEGRAFGELEGTGIWNFHAEPEGTHVRYLWRVDVTKPWMKLMAPILAPMFAWNHNKVMCWGLAGARKALAAAPPSPQTSH
ncbi:MAG: SRPBCC family protein [Sphingomonas sp.]